MFVLTDVENLGPGSNAKYVSMYVCTHVCMYVCLYVCACVCVCFLCVCMYIRMYGCMYVSMCVCMKVEGHACQCDCMNVCMDACMCVCLRSMQKSPGVPGLLLEEPLSVECVPRPSLPQSAPRSWEHWHCSGWDHRFSRLFLSRDIIP